MRKRFSIRAISLLCVGVFSLSFCGIVMAAKPAAYKEIDVSGGGTIEGTVKWTGEAPEAKQFPVQKDTEACGAEPKPSPRLLVSSDGGVKNTVVYLVDVTEGKKMSELQAATKLDQTSCIYEPHILLFPAGEKLDIVNSDDVLHNVHMYGAATYNLAFPTKGQVISKKLRKPGVIESVCDASHYWMSSYIHVVTHPYYAITDKDGKYKIDKIPPGKYKLQAWHEGWTIVDKKEKEGAIDKLVFSDPVILEKDIEVKANDVLTVDWELSD